MDKRPFPMLALVGSGEYLPPIAALDRELIGRLAAPVRVVCLPTAAGTEGHERIDYWSRLGVEHFSSLGVQVQAVPVIAMPRSSVITRSSSPSSVCVSRSRT